MESCPTQAVLPLVGLAAEKVIRDPYNWGGRGRAVTAVTAPCEISYPGDPLVGPVRNTDAWHGGA
ncbi:MAG: hypothetical protein ACQESR_21345 [Planctomycetota bacterium]